MLIPELSDKWKSRCDDFGDIHSHRIIYNLGFPKITESEIFLHHDDVIKIITKLLADPKFIIILKAKFPIILIDEYQDTNKDLALAIVENLVEADNSPIVGFFGDHWQKIFGSSSCGLITAKPEKMKVIGKQANFRSDRLIVEALNNIRPQLTQSVRDPESVGDIKIYCTDNWVGARRTDNHWQQDLPALEAHQSLEKAKQKLADLGWDFVPEVTKILMLTNNVLAAEQGYQNLLSAFTDSDDVLKKTVLILHF